MTETQQQEAAVPPTETLLDELVQFFQKYLVLEEEHFSLLALWTAHTYVFRAFHFTPYLLVTSAHKGSGKSTVLDCLDALVANPERADCITTSAFIRLVDAQQPTLLLDEADAAFGRGGNYAEALRGILNSGFKSTGIYRMSANKKTPEGETWEPTVFRTFCPKAIAAIGALPDTVTDRSIPLRIKPKLRDQKVAQFRHTDAEAATPLRQALAQWGEGVLPQLTMVRPEVPDSLWNRAADVAEPLLAIAATASSAWYERALGAIVSLLSRDDHAEPELGIQLLADIKEVFCEDRISTQQLLRRLKTLEESPWNEWHPQWRTHEGLTAAALGRLLTPYEIKSGSLRLNGTDKTVKGYHRPQFDEALEMYLK